MVSYKALNTINKNKEKYIFMFILYFYLLIFFLKEVIRLPYYLTTN